MGPAPGWDGPSAHTKALLPSREKKHFPRLGGGWMRGEEKEEEKGGGKGRVASATSSSSRREISWYMGSTR